MSRGGTTPKEEELEELDRGVRAWSPIGSAAWALWGVVSARSQVEAVQKGDEEYAPEFEYLVSRSLSFSFYVSSHSEGILTVC